MEVIKLNMCCCLYYWTMLMLMLMIAGSVTSFGDVNRVLSQYPRYSRFSNYLTQTQLVGPGQSLTVLAVDNSGLGPLDGKSMEHIKNILTVHVALQYLDLEELQYNPEGITLTTLSTPTALLKINKAGTVTFVSAAHPNGVVRAKLIKAIYSDSNNNISVVHVNGLIMPPSKLPPPPVISPVIAPVLTPFLPPALPPVTPPLPVPVISPTPAALPIIPSAPLVSPLLPPAPAPSPLLPLAPVLSPVPAMAPVPGSGEPPTLGSSAAPANQHESGVLQSGLNWSLALFLTLSSTYMLYR